MAHSSLLGIEPTQRPAPGHDSAALRPSDSSDSGSDIAGLNEPDEGGLSAPVDKATGADIERPATSHESVGPGIDSDARGTGERRSAGGDAGREAADISPDRIVSDPNAGGVMDDPSDGLTEPEVGELPNADVLVDATWTDPAAQPGDDEDEDEDADPVGAPGDRS